LTANTFSNLPHISEPVRYVIGLLHQLGFAHANPSQTAKIDTYIIQPLYDAEYALLQVQESQKNTGILPNYEALMVETFQLYFWAGLRGLPPQTRLFDQLVAHVMKTLLPFLQECAPEDHENSPVTATGFTLNHPIDHNYASRALHHPITINNIVAWSLTLGCKVTATLKRPEHEWFRGHWLLHIRAMGLDLDEEAYQHMLDIFPSTDGFPGMILRSVFTQLQTS
jgi:hypothetical protein